MNRWKFFTPLGLSLILSFSSLAANPSLDVSPRKITVGDPVEVEISVPVSSGEKIIFPTQDNFSPAEIIRVDTIDAKSSRSTYKYIISLFEPGEVDLPDLPVIVLSTGSADTLWLDPGRIEVSPTVENPDTSTIRDIRPPVKLSWTFKEMLPYLIGGVIAIALIAVFWIWWRKQRRERGEIPEFVPPPIPPDIIALRKLEELRVKKLWQDGKPKQFHSELTDILKEYIEKRYEFNALEMTSEELFGVRSKWAGDDDQFASMRRILTIADLVKFAKFSPSAHDHERSLELAFAYVETTRPSRTPLIAEAS